MHRSFILVGTVALLGLLGCAGEEGPPIGAVGAYRYIPR